VSAAPAAPLTIDPALLLSAYAQGLFPMADGADDPSVHWIEPRLRAILPLDGFHLSRSLAKAVAAESFTVTVDTAFPAIVDLCAEAAADRPTTWINAIIRSSYAALFARGHAHSVECWQDGALVGGLYGVALGRAFFGESMVSRRTNASKVALAHLVARLRAGGWELLDCQFMTPHLASLGAVELPQKAYLRLLHSAVSGAGVGGGDGAGAEAGAAAAGDWGALDAAGAAFAAGTGRATGSPPGKLIVQLLTKTS
jgi:leucyl/phenylalanyl-tRNA---protein transferase